MFFSGIGRQRAAGASGFGASQQRGEDLESTIELTLHEAFEGGKKSVSLQVEDLCPRCHGTGTDRNKICTQCHGTGRVRETKRFDVTIPRGVKDGQRIRLAGPRRRPARAAARAAISISSCTSTATTGTSARATICTSICPVSIYELILGGEVRVPTMTGDVTMTIPAGTQNNKMLRLSGKGMPKLKDGGYGDEYVRLIGQLPTNLTDKEQKLYRELAGIRNGKRG